VPKLTGIGQLVGGWWLGGILFLRQCR